MAWGGKNVTRPGASEKLTMIRKGGSLRGVLSPAPWEKSPKRSSPQGGRKASREGSP